MEDSPKEDLRETPPEAGETPPKQTPPKNPRGKTDPGVVAAGGAFFCLGLGLGMPGAIAGAVLGLALGLLAEKHRKESGTAPGTVLKELLTDLATVGLLGGGIPATILLMLLPFRENAPEEMREFPFIGIFLGLACAAFLISGIRQKFRK